MSRICSLMGEINSLDHETDTLNVVNGKEEFMA